MYTNNQIKSLARIYRTLADAVHGDKGVNYTNFSNACMFPMREITKLINITHSMHKMTPKIDKIIAYEYATFFPDFDPEEYNKNFDTCLSLPMQGVFQMEYRKKPDYDGKLTPGVKAMRQKAGYGSAKELAEKMNVSLRQVQRWESGESAPSVKDAQNLADVLGCSINDLF